MRKLLPLLLAAAVTAPAAAISIRLHKGVAVRFSERPSEWTARTDAPPGAESTLVRVNPENGSIHELWRARRGWVWPEQVLERDSVVIVLSGKLYVRTGTIRRELKPGGSAVLPAGTPFELGSLAWFRRTVFVYATNAPLPQTPQQDSSSHPH
ncbi:MAG: hypothetical protein HYZ75_06685 [Elusimicrobia bacterium]|nr:hypothetical protein [Elusimicrobiota bacterium]